MTSFQLQFVVCDLLVKYSITKRNKYRQGKRIIYMYVICTSQVELITFQPWNKYILIIKLFKVFDGKRAPFLQEAPDFMKLIPHRAWFELRSCQNRYNAYSDWFMSNSSDGRIVISDARTEPHLHPFLNVTISSIKLYGETYRISIQRLSLILFPLFSSPSLVTTHGIF